MTELNKDYSHDYSQDAQLLTDEGKLPEAADMYKKALDMAQGFGNDNPQQIEHLQHAYSGAQVAASQQLMDRATDPSTSPKDAYNAVVEIETRMKEAGFDIKNDRGYQDSRDGCALLGTTEAGFAKLASDTQASANQAATQQQIVAQAPKVQAPGTPQP